MASPFRRICWLRLVQKALSWCHIRRPMHESDISEGLTRVFVRAKTMEYFWSTGKCFRILKMSDWRAAMAIWGLNREEQTSLWYHPQGNRETTVQRGTGCDGRTQHIFVKPKQLCRIWGSVCLSMENYSFKGPTEEKKRKLRKSCPFMEQVDMQIRRLSEFLWQEGDLGYCRWWTHKKKLMTNLVMDDTKIQVKINRRN